MKSKAEMLPYIFFKIIEFHIEWIGSGDLATFLGQALSICANTKDLVLFWPRPYCRGSTSYRTEPEMQSSYQGKPPNSSLEGWPKVVLLVITYLIIRV